MHTPSQLKQLKWVQGFEAKASTLRTLVLSAGSEWWQQHNYASHLEYLRPLGSNDRRASTSLTRALS